MKIEVAEVRKCLKAFDFPTLFREHLGWDKHHGTLDIPIDGSTMRLSAVAQKRGFVAYVCWCGAEGLPWSVREGGAQDEAATPDQIPDRPTRLKIDHQVTKSAREHFIIYADKESGEQVWQWVRREPGKPLASRDHRFDAKQSGDYLIQRLEQIAVDMEEEEQLTLFEVTGKAKAAFDVDKVTKKFYERFKAEHAAFLKFIKGIKSQADLEWYTSLMLNRLMFVYFIQKKGFLNGDTNYLQNRMKLVREAKGKDKFLTFYSYFLVRLFHDGLGKSPEDRKLNRDLEKLLGKVPYLNGGFFEVHQLEERNKEIDIPDKAFEKLFAFFDEFRWHLDERPLRANNEINPDVVGYIFEKYINQKQMGAYYTKEDITEYISKNTIIPFLFDAAEKKCPIAFKPDSFLWRLLRDNPDRYIYAAVRHGVVDDQGNVTALPKEIAAGVKDVAKREDWNKAADDALALPTETWREHVARRTRCLELRETLSRGEVNTINDLITLNLDIWQFARDAIVNSEGPELLRAFWQAIGNVTVLDPTCGSGAFLFAALRILESLYSDCLERMERFVEDVEADLDAVAGESRGAKPEKFSDFKKVLAQIAKHPNERYFILKSIIISNLFGVDIMEEAVEICKLRLFLKLVAQVDTADQIEPLPDIDFNMRAGNSLVGYVSLNQVRKARESEARGTSKQKLMLDSDADAEIRRIEEDAFAVEKAFQQFRAQQTQHGGRVTAEDKQELRRRLSQLDMQLDRYLAAEYRVGQDSIKSKAAYHDALNGWRESHGPFHWFVEFYGIMAEGGFSVVIGNPPYVEYSKVRKEYQVRGFETEACGNLYAMCIERSFEVLSPNGRFGFIVQAPLVSTQRMANARSVLRNQSSCTYYSTYDDRPSKLFDGMHHCRLAIVLSKKAEKRATAKTFTTRYHKWYKEERPNLFQSLAYLALNDKLSGDIIPKFRCESESVAYATMCAHRHQMSDLLSATPSQYQVFYKITGVGHWFCFTLNPPKFWRNGRLESSTRESSVYFRTKKLRDTAYCCLSSSMHYWLYQARTNCRDYNPSDLAFMPLPEDIANGLPEFTGLATRIMKRLEETSEIGEANYAVGGLVKFQRFRPKAAKELFDSVDDMLAGLYGLTPEQQDFIINYDVKYRMGLDGTEDDE